MKVWLLTSTGEEYGGVEVSDNGGDGGGGVDAGLRAARPRLQRAQHCYNLKNTRTCNELGVVVECTLKYDNGLPYT